MGLSRLDAAIACFYLGFLLLVAFMRGRRGGSAGEFLLAGRRITLLPFIASVAASWYGGILGVGEYSYRYGLSNWLVFGVPYYLGATLFALLLAKRVRRTRFYSIPDALETAYGRVAAVIGAVVVLLVSAPAAYVLMLGVLARLAFGWPLAWGVVIGTLFSTVYLFRGGLRADVVTDIGQFLLMFLGFGILVAALALEHGTIGFWRQHLPAGHLTWNGGRDASSILVWYFLALSALIEPSFYQRCFAARDEATARKGILLAVPFWFVFDMLTTSAGLYARAILPGLADPVASYPAIGASALPEGARGLFLVALLATIMSTVDTYAFLAGQTAGRDLWWRMRGMQSEDRVSRYTRWGLLVTAVISIALALYFQSVIGIWHDIGSVATPALLIPVATSLSPRLRMSRRAALAAMLGGGGLPLAWLIAGRVAGGAPGLGWMAGVEPIYSGLAFSAACFLGDRALRKVGGDTGRARSEKA